MPLLEWFGDVNQIVDHLGTYVDVDYTQWLVWLFTPVLVVILLPAAIVLLLYFSSIVVHINKLRKKKLLTWNEEDFRRSSLTLVGAVWDAHSSFWHGYEVRGMHNIPDSGGALLIFYHGALPVDGYYLVSRCWLHKRRLIHAVADRFVFKIPGWSILWDTFGVSAGTVQSCVSQLQRGDLMIISPGGVYEAQMGDHNYELLWKQRVGFAKVALEAKVPIIPVFTRNIREAYRTFNVCRPFWRWIYHMTRLPLVPVYGNFPVKLVTYLGQPILPDASETPESLAEKVANQLELLIERHQKRPGKILRALYERFSGVKDDE